MFVSSSSEALKASEDERMFAIMDEISRPRPRCGLTSLRYPAKKHLSEDVCMLALAENVLES